jgi:protein-tyrosine phosphatase
MTGFILTPPRGGVSMNPVMRSRMVPLKTVWNLRDAGGLRTRRGSRVKRGLLYRGGDLSALSDEDAEELEKRGVKTVVDFRTDEERDLKPDKKPDFLSRVITIPVNSASTAQMGRASPEEVSSPDLMIRVYQDLVRNFREEYAKFFALIRDPALAPLLFHCSFGKDRTGLPAAILLEVLGVDRETVMEDYMLSKEATDLKFGEFLLEHPEYVHILTVKPRYLEAAYRIIDDEFGGMENYVRKELRIDRERLLSLYTE